MGTFPKERDTYLLPIRINFWHLLTLVTYSWYHIVQLTFSGQLNCPTEGKKSYFLQEAKYNTWLKLFGTFSGRKVCWNRIISELKKTYSHTSVPLRFLIRKVLVWNSCRMKKSDAWSLSISAYKVNSKPLICLDR